MTNASIATLSLTIICTFNILNKVAKQKLTVRLLVILSLFIASPFILIAVVKQQNLIQHAQVVPPGIFPVYGLYANVLDNFANGWTTAILYGGPTAYDLYNKAPVYSGTNSLRYVVTAPWDELKFIAPQSFDISSYVYLTFYALAGAPGQNFELFLIDANGQPLPQKIQLSQYAPLDTNFWTTYNIPISAFNLTNSTILGMVFKDANGGTYNMQPPPPVYFDEINFSIQKGENLPPPPGAIQITPPTLIPTPIFPYYPSISPWVFIIPGIIILLAIIIQ